MEITLYYAGPSRATRVRWLLEELEVDYEIVPVSLAAPRFERDADFLRVSPYGTVPGLEIKEGDGTSLTMCESAAIVIWLCDRFAEKGFAPPPESPERADYLNWILLATTTMETPLWQMARHTFVLPAEKRRPEVVALGKEEWADIAGMLEARLGGREFAVGKSFSAADIMLTHTLRWAQVAKQLDDHPTLRAYAARHADRPAFARAAAPVV